MPKKQKKKGKTDADESLSGSSTIKAEVETMSTRSAKGSSVNSEIEQINDLDEDAEEKGQMDTTDTHDNFEEQLKEAIDGLNVKSAGERLKNIKSINSSLRKKLLTEFLLERYVTLADGLERCLKKGRGEEQVLSAKGLTLLCLHLGITDQGEALYSMIKPSLVTVLMDPSAGSAARAACAEALGLCGFISCNDLEASSHMMTDLESIFIKSYLKGDHTAPSLTADSYLLHCAALEAWGLLLSITTPSILKLHMDRHLLRLPDLLESSDLDIRISGGESIALLYELVRDQNEDFEWPNKASLSEKLKQLSTENSKHQAKKGRKQQRSSFRDILHYIEDGNFNDEECKFGKEAVYIDSWARKRQYDALCSLLESGTNIHLQENVLLRDIFGLGDPLPSGAASNKMSKNDRRLYNQAVFKARTQARSKLRDKRVAHLSG